LAVGDEILFRLSTRTVAVAEHPPLVAVIVTVWFCVGAVIAAGVKVVFCPLVGDTEPALVVQLIPATLLVTAAVPLVHIAAGPLMLVVLWSTLTFSVVEQAPLVAVMVVVAF
jgi:hypothetical protein